MNGDKGFRGLKVWQKSMDLTIEVYRATKQFPKEEAFGLTSQARRAAVSISSNIAEGSVRSTKGEFRQFVGIARGSLAELATQLELADRLGYLAEGEFTKLDMACDEIGKMLTALWKSLVVPKP